MSHIHTDYKRNTHGNLDTVQRNQKQNRYEYLMSKSREIMKNVKIADRQKRFHR